MRAHAAIAVTVLIFGCALICAADASAAAGSSSGTLLDAVLKARDDIESATEELTRLEDSVAAERAPLARKVDALEAEVRELRETAANARRARAADDAERRALIEQAGSLEEDCNFAHSLLSEYRRSVETRTVRAEHQLMEKRLAVIDEALDSKDRYERLSDALRGISEMVHARHAARRGGMAFEGVALDEDGIECEGRFAVFGPVAYFSCADGETAGLTVTRLGSSQVSVFTDIDEEARDGVRTLVSGGSATVPVDLSSGDALKVARARTSLVAHLKKGGVVMLPLAAVGLVALVLIVKKVGEIRRFHVGPHPGVRDVMRLLRDGDVDAARNEAMRMGEPLSNVMRDIAEHGSSPTEYVEEVVHERILTHAHELERHLGMIAVLGGVAPLLGLLGTVTGMIHTFKLVTIFGTGDARLLSGGISEALVTTEFGLVIAIPILLIHAYLLRRVRGMVARLEETAAEAIRGR